MTTKRRDFLKWAALGGGALVMPSGLVLSSCSQAAAGAYASLARRTDHYFIFYFMVGGWDLLLATDPVTPKPGVHVPYDGDRILDVGTTRLGPMMRPVLPYMDRAAILRGIYVDALNHPQARFRMVTGKFKQPGQIVPPSIQTMIGKAHADKYELLNVSSDALRPAVFRGAEDRKLDALRVGSVEQLRSLTNVASSTERSRERIQQALAAKDALFAKRYADEAMVQDVSGFAELSRLAGASALPARLRGAAQDAANGPMLGDKLATQASIAIQCVKEDIAPCITVGTGEFDSHTGPQYAGHTGSVRRGFEMIGLICRGLDDAIIQDGSTLMDKTTIVVTSEFSRTPDLNELGGKHHWPANSMLLIGKGVKRSRPGQGPVVFGGTDDGLFPLEINPETGSKKKGVELLDVTHGLATVLAIAGQDPRALLRQDPIAHLIG